MQENYDIPIHDIKPLIEIHEYSFYYFLGVSAIVVVVLMGLLYLLFKWFKNRNRFNLRKEHFKLLNAVDFSKSKSAAYAITLYGATFKDDSQRHHHAYSNLVEKLEQYKYKKEVASIDDETIHYMNLYRGMIDV